MLKQILASLLLMVVIVPNAHAYIDPGSGSLMIQMLIASAIGGLFTLKAYFRTIKEKVSNFCLKKENRKENKNKEIS